MEFNTLGEEIEWETRRVAAAFGIEAWITQFRTEEPEMETNTEEVEGGEDVCFGTGNSGEFVAWSIYHSENFEIELRGISVSPDEHSRMSLRFNDSLGTGRKRWELNGEDGAELMARGLYCLGFEDKKILAQLPELTAHEKLELRLSLPHEFWPPHWADEV